MSEIIMPRFVVIEVLCDELPTRHEQDKCILNYLVANKLPAYESKEYVDFQGVMDIHFLVYGEDVNLEACVMFKVVQNG